jgi:hypothetical protein
MEKIPGDETILRKMPPKIGRAQQWLDPATDRKTVNPYRATSAISPAR